MNAAALEARLALIARGFHIFPTIPGGKRPAVKDWEAKATTDPDLIAAWPAGAGIGIACGPSNLVVLDLDAHGGEPPAKWQQPGINDGLDVLAAVWAEHETDSSFLHTMTVQTPSGGLHCYFATPDREVRNSAGKIGWQVDVRAAGGYVVGPGTVIDTDHGPRPYELICAPDDLQVLPGWLVDVLTPREPAQRAAIAYQGRDLRDDLAGLLRVVLTAQPGERNARLYWAARRAMEKEDVNLDAAQRILADAAQRIGLSEQEARQTIRSAFRGANA
ncbi:bifunctional DNA primase/polymerase [Kocuria sp. U4B]